MQHELFDLISEVGLGGFLVHTHLNTVSTYQTESISIRNSSFLFLIDLLIYYLFWHSQIRLLTHWLRKWLTKHLNDEMTSNNIVFFSSSILWSVNSQMMIQIMLSRLLLFIRSW